MYLPFVYILRWCVRIFLLGVVVVFFASVFLSTDYIQHAIKDSIYHQSDGNIKIHGRVGLYFSGYPSLYATEVSINHSASLPSKVSEIEPASFFYSDRLIFGFNFLKLAILELKIDSLDVSRSKIWLEKNDGESNFSLKEALSDWVAFLHTVELDRLVLNNAEIYYDSKTEPVKLDAVMLYNGTNSPVIVDLHGSYLKNNFFLHFNMSSLEAILHKKETGIKANGWFGSKQNKFQINGVVKDLLEIRGANFWIEADYMVKPMSLKALDDVYPWVEQARISAEYIQPEGVNSSYLDNIDIDIEGNGLISKVSGKVTDIFGDQNVDVDIKSSGILEIPKINSETESLNFDWKFSGMLRGIKGSLLLTVEVAQLIAPGFSSNGTGAIYIENNNLANALNVQVKISDTRIFGGYIGASIPKVNDVSLSGAVSRVGHEIHFKNFVLQGDNKLDLKINGSFFGKKNHIFFAGDIPFHLLRTSSTQSDFRNIITKWFPLHNVAGEMIFQKEGVFVVDLESSSKSKWGQLKVKNGVLSKTKEKGLYYDLPIDGMLPSASFLLFELNPKWEQQKHKLKHLPPVYIDGVLTAQNNFEKEEINIKTKKNSVAMLDMTLDLSPVTLHSKSKLPSSNIYGKLKAYDLNFLRALAPQSKRELISSEILPLGVKFNSKKKSKSWGTDLEFDVERDDNKIKLYVNQANISPLSGDFSFDLNGQISPNVVKEFIPETFQSVFKNANTVASGSFSILPNNEWSIEKIYGSTSLENGGQLKVVGTAKKNKEIIRSDISLDINQLPYQSITNVSSDLMMNGSIHIRGDKKHLLFVDLNIGENDIVGQVHFKRFPLLKNDNIEIISGKFTSNKFDLIQLIKNTKKDQEKFFSKDHFWFSPWFGNLKGQVDFHFRHFLNKNLSLKNKLVRFKFNEDQWHVRLHDNSDDSLVGYTSITRRNESEALNFSLRLFADQADISLLNRRSVFNENADKKGNFSLDLDLSGVGESFFEVASNMNGKINASLWNVGLQDQSYLIGSDLWIVFIDLSRVLLATDDRLFVKCGVLSLPVNDGKVIVDKGVKFDSSQLQLYGGGEIDLAKEQIKWTVNTQTYRNFAFKFGGLPKKFSVTGSLANPVVSMQAGSVFQSFVEGASLFASFYPLLVSGMLSDAKFKGMCLE